MKKISIILTAFIFAGLALSSCNNSTSSTTETPKDSSTTPVAQKIDYPYTIDHPDNWEMGSQQNTLNALNALKAWENHNLDESLKYFGDSIHVQFDGFDKKISNDSLRAFFSRGMASTKSHSVKMEDWESVISKDKKTEYVTLWYRQYEEGMNGKKDSIDVINDLKMKDGKITGLAEYTRKLN